MMNFTFKHDAIHFEMELIGPVRYYPLNNHLDGLNSEDLKDLENKKADIYQLFVKSTLKEQSQTHFHPSLLLSRDKEQLQEDLEWALDELGIIKKVAHHWSLHNSKSGPSWSIF